jgi:hypothetical protein
MNRSDRHARACPAHPRLSCRHLGKVIGWPIVPSETGGAVGSAEHEKCNQVCRCTRTSPADAAPPIENKNELSCHVPGWNRIHLIVDELPLFSELETVDRKTRCVPREERTRASVWDRSADHIRASSQTAALKGRIHGCTRTLREKVRFFSLAPRAPSIHDPSRKSSVHRSSRDDVDLGEAREQSSLHRDHRRFRMATRSSINSADRSYAAAKIMKAITGKYTVCPLLSAK